MMSKWQLNFLRKTNNAEKQVTKDVRLKVFELASQPQQLYHLQILLQVIITVFLFLFSIFIAIIMSC